MAKGVIMSRTGLGRYLAYVYLLAGTVSSLANTRVHAIKVPDSFYGHNLEFTRHDLYEGLSAEMIANKKFAVLPGSISSWPMVMQKLAAAGLQGKVPRWTDIPGAGNKAMLDEPMWGNVSGLVHNLSIHYYFCCSLIFLHSIL